MSLAPAAGGTSDGLRAVAVRAAGGDREAVEALVRATSAAVWRTCAALVDPASADDLTQDTFARAIRALPGYRGESSPVRWLLAIARRTCADEIRRRRRDRRLAGRLELERVTEVDRTSLGVELSDALARLAQPRLEAFMLTVVNGLSYAEAAAVCDCPVGTIRSRVARARDELQQAMAGTNPARHRGTDGR